MQHPNSTEVPSLRKNQALLPATPPTPLEFFIALAFALAFGLVLGLTSGQVIAEEDDESEFDEAHLFFELNSTDGDLGIHALIDGDAWKRLTIRNEKDREILDVRVRSALRKQGLTEIFFESAEPTFDELAPEDFFNRFPPGTYEIEGKTLEGEELESETELTHVMPAPPVPVVNGVMMASQCDEDEPGYNAPVLTTPITISWPQVTESHPDADGGGAAIQPQVPVTIYNYEVVVEAEIEVDGEEFTTTVHILVPHNITEVSIPEEFISQSDVFKYEVLAREESFNQTAIESCFQI